MFVDYYSNFEKSYKRGLEKDKNELIDIDLDHLSFTLMGISTFLGLKPMLNNGERLSEEEINKIADSITTILSTGLFKK